MTTVTDAAPDRLEGCPKAMVYGPCGGVRTTGGCEVAADRRCAFLDVPLRPWGGPQAPPAPPTQVPTVVTDLHVAPRDLASLREVAGHLRGTCDAVLAGDHGGARNDFAPSFLAASMAAAGLRPWVTLSCRDRNRVALGAELAALAELGVAGVHCVTGDWQGLAGSAGEAKVFDLDCLRLVALARETGLTVSVAATPASPPGGLRPLRLREKVAAGAQVCFVNHCGGATAVRRFVDEARNAGADIPFVPCVAVTSDARSLAALAVLPGTALDDDAVEESRRGRRGAVDLAAEAARRMLAIDGVAGVNLSGAASSESPGASAAIMASVGRQLRDGHRP